MCTLGRKRLRMTPNKDFALLVGKAFLQETHQGHRDAAIAFGRAFLLALGKQGIDETPHTPPMHHKHHAENPVHA